MDRESYEELLSTGILKHAGQKGANQLLSVDFDAVPSGSVSEMSNLSRASHTILLLLIEKRQVLENTILQWGND
jgi:hypothetical protein